MEELQEIYDEHNNTNLVSIYRTYKFRDIRYQIEIKRLELKRSNHHDEWRKFDKQIRKNDKRIFKMDAAIKIQMWWRKYYYMPGNMGYNKAKDNFDSIISDTEQHIKKLGDDIFSINSEENKIAEENDQSFLLLGELLYKQLNDIQSNKLQFSDIEEICKYITTSIFDEDNCCNGSITNGTHINFFFNGENVDLRRLLYNNFVEELRDDENLKLSCENKEKCQITSRWKT